MASALVSTEKVLEEMLAAKALIFERMKARAGDLEDYQFLRQTLLEVDVSKDSDYRRVFNRFYKMRQKPASWYQFYFGLLELNKRRTGIGFDEVLKEIFVRFNEVHPSFSSKLIATIDPHMPVYDDEVCSHLGIPRRRYSDPPAQRLEKASQNYSHIVQFHREALVASPAAALLSGFDTSLPQFSSFTRTKKIDVMLWLWRPAANAVDA